MPPKRRPEGPLTHEELRMHLHYDPETGVFTWIHPAPRRVVGARAGYEDHKGYRRLTICGKEWMEHRLAWFYMERCVPPPDLQVDHINLVRNDNRWKNLRLVDQGTNQANTPRYGEMRGIMERGSSFRVHVNVNGRRTNMSFPTLEEAISHRDRIFKEQWGHDVIKS